MNSKEWLKQTQNFIKKFNDDETTTLAASLAFYTALSLAPTLILFVLMTSHFTFDFKNIFLQRASRLIGDEGSEALKIIIENAQHRTDLKGFASLFGLIALLISSSFVFGELRFALNRIFKSQINYPDNSTLMNWLFLFFKERFLHILLAIVYILSLAATLIISSYLSAPIDGKTNFLFVLINILFSTFIYSAFFSFMFLYVPWKSIPLKQGLIGGFLTALMFVVGKETIGLYLGRNGLTSAYGAAGSVVFFMAWIYYSALITLCGAQICYLMAEFKQEK